MARKASRCRRRRSGPPRACGRPAMPPSATARSRDAEALPRGTVTPHKETVQRYMDGFRTGDNALVLSCLTDDVEWMIPGAFHLCGKEAFDGEIENDAFVGRPTIEVTRLVEEGDVGAGEGTGRLARGGGGGGAGGG